MHGAQCTRSLTSVLRPKDGIAPARSSDDAVGQGAGEPKYNAKPHLPKGIDAADGAGSVLMLCVCVCVCVCVCKASTVLREAKYAQAQSRFSVTLRHPTQRHPPLKKTWASALPQLCSFAVLSSPIFILAPAPNSSLHSFPHESQRVPAPTCPVLPRHEFHSIAGNATGRLSVCLLVRMIY